MGEGPRDWSPPGYWDSPPPPPRMRSVPVAPAAPAPKPAVGQPRLSALVAVLLGLVACWWPLSLVGAPPGFRGFAFTTAGITAVFLASRASRGGYKVLGGIGLMLGLGGTILSGWSVAAHHLPWMPAAPSLHAAPPAPGSPDLQAELSGAATAPRVVEPFAAASVTADPTGQLRANLRYIASALGVGLGASSQYGGGFPAALVIHRDGTVAAAHRAETFSKVPEYVELDYVLSADGQTFTLRVIDSMSGMAVRTDSSRVVIDE